MCKTFIYFKKFVYIWTQLMSLYIMQQRRLIFLYSIRNNKKKVTDVRARLLEHPV